MIEKIIDPLKHSNYKKNLLKISDGDRKLFNKINMVSERWKASFLNKKYHKE